MRLIKCVAALIVTTASLCTSTESAKAQHIKVPKDPVQFVDAVTGETISEVLVMPRYSLYRGVFIAPEGPSKAIVSNYLDHPFVYRAGDPFKIKQPRVFVGLPLLMVFIGQGKDLDGILVVARDYFPLWTEDLWLPKLKLSPIPHQRWLELMTNDLQPVLNNRSHLKENCEIWQIGERCNLKIKYDKKERALVRSFVTAGEGPK
ncbi:MAG TPA: hypothetical protein VL866_15735 [Pyrinomonadaceae bacterium]|nr:hypothetical protein [Pyrinomonadaceae bacterium]